MLRQPDDLDAAFEYAAVSAELGDLEGAISTLERMLIFAPGLPRLQFELGVLYYRLGAYQTAATYFRSVEAAPDVPPEVQGQVAAYLAAVERRATGTQLSGFAMTGLRVQSNANAGPASAAITLNGIGFTLSPGAVGQPDANAFISGGLNFSTDVPSQGDRFNLSLAGYGSLYRTQGQLNTGVIELRAGPEFDLGRIRIDNANIGVYGVVGGAIVGGAPYLLSGGAGSNLTIALDARSELRLRGEARYSQYLDSPQRPTASLRSGPQVSGEISYRYQVTPELGLFMSAGLDRRWAQRNYLSAWQAGARAGATYAFASPIEALEAPWRIGISASAQHLIADAPDPVFSPVDPEKTTTVSLEGKLTIPLPNAFAIEASAGYTRALSNYGLSSYDNLWASIGIGRSF